MFGHNPNLKPDPYGPAAARALLASAGYPNGFDVTLAAPNDRYTNDQKVAQAVAAMLTRVGIRVCVEAMRASCMFPRGAWGDFRFFLTGIGSGSGEGSHTLRAMMYTPSPMKGHGNSNYGDYSNPNLDRLIDQAMTTVDNAKREALLHEAIALAMQDYAVMPVYWEVSAWARRAAIDYTARVDQYNSAMLARPANTQ